MLNHRRTFIYICFLFLLLLASPCVAEEVGFDVGELRDIASGAALSSYVTRYFILPGTNIKAGVVSYVFVTKPDGYDPTAKIVFMINDNEVYFIGTDGMDDTKDYSRFDVGGDCVYGAYKDYFTMACTNFGASSSCRKMFLFRYGKDKIELLDFIDDVGISCFLPATDFNFHWEPGEDSPANLPIAKVFGDVDGDGAPEILLMSGDRGDPDGDCPFYLEIVNDRLRVDTNPELYKPFFDLEIKKAGAGQKSYAYYVTGFLSGMLSMDRVKRALSDNANYYYDAMYFIGDIDNVDVKMHNYGKDDNGGAIKPVLKHYEIKWR